MDQHMSRNVEGIGLLVGVGDALNEPILPSLSLENFYLI